MVEIESLQPAVASAPGAEIGPEPNTTPGKPTDANLEEKRTSPENALPPPEPRSPYVELGAFKGHANVVTSVAFSPDGKEILSGGWDKTIRLWDVATRQEIRRFGSAEPGPSPWLNFLANGASPGDRDRWMLGAAFFHQENWGPKGWVTSTAFSPDGQWLLTGGLDKVARLWDKTTGHQSRCFAGHTETVSSAIFTPDGKQVLSAGWDQTLRLWDIETGKELQKFIGHTGVVNAVAITRDGKQALSGSWDRTLRLWDLANATSKRLDGHKDMVQGVALSPDGTVAVSASADKTVRLWDLAAGKEKLRFEGHTEPVRCVAFSPDGKFVVTGSGGRDRSLRVFEVATGKELHHLEGHADEIWSVAVSPDGRAIVSAGVDQLIRLWGPGPRK